MNYHVIHAQYKENYKIYFEFKDGKKGIVNLEDYLWGPVFEPLKSIETFKKFKLNISSHTIEWENGADIAPETLYQSANN